MRRKRKRETSDKKMNEWKIFNRKLELVSSPCHFVKVEKRDFSSSSFTSLVRACVLKYPNNVREPKTKTIKTWFKTRAKKPSNEISAKALRLFDYENGKFLKRLSIEQRLQLIAVGETE